MDKKIRILLITNILLITAIYFVFHFTFFVESKEVIYKTTPALNDGEKWIIGYYQGGDYFDYTRGLRGTVERLAEWGWMKKIDFDNLPKNMTSSELWNYLSQNVKSDYIKFSSEYSWSADWDPQTRALNKKEAIKALQLEKVDVMMAMGTWAGIDLVNNNHSTSLMVMSASDPIQSKIIDDMYDSGYDHVHVKVSPNKFVNQIKIFHNLTGFRKIGVIYDESEEGEVFANMDDLRRAATMKNFEIISCISPEINLSKEEIINNAKECYEKLAPKIDAMWMTGHRAEEPETVPQLLPALIEYNIPSWATNGLPGVDAGVLFASLSDKELYQRTTFYATVLSKILNGAKPREISQILDTDLSGVVFNPQTAEKIGLNIPSLNLTNNTIKITKDMYD